MCDRAAQEIIIRHKTEEMTSWVARSDPSNEHQKLPHIKICNWIRRLTQAEECESVRRLFVVVNIKELTKIVQVIAVIQVGGINILLPIKLKEIENAY